MNKLTGILLALFITLLSIFVMAPKGYAFDPLEETCDGSVGATSSSVCEDKDKGGTLTDKTNGIIPKIANIIAAVGGLIAVIFIMINGFNIMTSTGDSAKIAKARDGLIYAAIGIVVIVLARTIIALILRYA